MPVPALEAQQHQAEVLQQQLLLTVEAQSVVEVRSVVEALLYRSPRDQERANPG